MGAAMSDSLTELRQRVLKLAVEYAKSSKKDVHWRELARIDEKLVEAALFYEEARPVVDGRVEHWGVKEPGVWLLPSETTRRRKILAIKLVRLLTGMDLRPAKDAVERVEPIRISDVPEDLDRLLERIMAHSQSEDLGTVMDMVAVI
jgi:hypothetical protein